MMMRKNASKKDAHRYIRRLQELRRDKVEHEGRAALHGLDDAMKKALDLLQMNCSGIPDDEKTLKELVTYFQQQVAVCERAKFVCVTWRHVPKLTNFAGAAGAGRCPGSSSDRPTAHRSVANETEGSGGWVGRLKERTASQASEADQRANGEFVVWCNQWLCSYEVELQNILRALVNRQFATTRYIEEYGTVKQWLNQFICNDQEAAKALHITEEKEMQAFVEDKKIQDAVCVKLAFSQQNFKKKKFFAGEEYFHQA
jgi:hypothetical protein